ncbi:MULTISPECIES: phosphoadenosine phosphosulfate reductase family protein [unclassified Gilliamella]|uniref:phosphoadenosine phosphosulfate reductase family protein n=2 Tax=unclassified Gilliamella TaxID=2685620 RepID=UPI002B4A03ED|nr:MULTISPECIES: phosphoadenosine phosphosulfate reductase family protein [unclassified Gilliamella]
MFLEYRDLDMKLLPKNVVSFSGGRSSALLVHLMKNDYPDTDFVFLDTGAEHPKTYEFIKNTVKHWGIKLTCLRVVVNPELGQGNSYRVITLDELKPDLQPFRDVCYKYGTPYVHGAFCTRTLKLEPFTRYCNETYGNGNYTTWLGIRADEPRRLQPKQGYKYLADICDFDKRDVIDWWGTQPFDLDLPEHLGNCVFCIKKSVNKIALATRDEPKMATDFINLINDPDVRVVERRQQANKIMYRGNNSLISIMAMYQNHTRDEIVATIRGRGGYDSGSCSESCELFSCQLGLDLDLSF